MSEYDLKGLFDNVEPKMPQGMPEVRQYIRYPQYRATRRVLRDWVEPVAMICLTLVIMAVIAVAILSLGGR